MKNAFTGKSIENAIFTIGNNTSCRLPSGVDGGRDREPRRRPRPQQQPDARHHAAADELHAAAATRSPAHGRKPHEGVVVWTSGTETEL